MCVRCAYFSPPSVASDNRAGKARHMPRLYAQHSKSRLVSRMARWSNEMVISRPAACAAAFAERWSGGDSPMKQIEVGIIGTGWCGGIRAHTCAESPLVKGLHLAEIRAERLAEVAAATNARTAVADYHHLLAIAEIEAIYISATPETTHFPMARDCL